MNRSKCNLKIYSLLKILIAFKQLKIFSHHIVSNLVFSAQSTITVVSRRCTFCRYTIIVKNMFMLKLVYIQIFKNSLTKWRKTQNRKTFLYINKSIVKSIHKTSHIANIKQNIHAQTSDTNFRRVSPFNITPLLKENIRLGHAGIVDHSV